MIGGERSSQIFRLAFREHVETFAVAIMLAVLLRIFVLGVYRIPTSAMEPSLFPGDFIFTYRLAYGLHLPFMEKKWVQRSPARGDVVVLSFAQQTFFSVRRVIGLPGDRIEFKGGELLVNDSKLNYRQTAEDEWLEENFGVEYKIRRAAKMADVPPLIVPPGQIYVLGDHRGLQMDSRAFGTVSMEAVEGRAVLIWMSVAWPENNAGGVQVRWSRLLSVI